MSNIVAWLPQAIVGTTFVIFGGLKLYGVSQGIVGGANVPPMQKLCGT